MGRETFRCAVCGKEMRKHTDLRAFIAKLWIFVVMVMWKGPDGVGWKRKRGISDYFLSHSLQMVMVLMVLMVRMVRGPDGEGGGASASSRRHLHPFPPQESPTLGKYIQI